MALETVFSLRATAGLGQGAACRAVPLSEARAARSAGCTSAAARHDPETRTRLAIGQRRVVDDRWPGRRRNQNGLRPARRPSRRVVSGTCRRDGPARPSCRRSGPRSLIGLLRSPVCWAFAMHPVSGTISLPPLGERKIAPAVSTFKRVATASLAFHQAGEICHYKRCLVRFDRCERISRACWKPQTPTRMAAHFRCAWLAVAASCWSSASRSGVQCVHVPVEPTSRCRRRPFTSRP